jgi:hypothetical protein
MRRHYYHKAFLIISFWILVSCSNTEVGSLPQPKSKPQLPLTQAETILPSPDGSWTAYFFGYDLDTFRLSVANFDDTVIWNVSQTNFGSEASFTPYRWSRDSRYLYFNIHVAIDGYVPFYQGGGLQRLDVLNGEVSEILPSGELISVNSSTHYRWNFPAFSLSPKDDKLAYITRMDNGIQLVIRDMKTNLENSLNFTQYSDAGRIIWSPKQGYLALAASGGTNWSNTLGFVEVVEVDTLASRTVVENKNGVFDPIVWLNSHTILLKERGGNYLYLDTTTEKLSPAPDLISFVN